jgi:hypothetical protein
MVISSRTPEGVPNRCPICGSQIRIEPSLPARDAPCPNCGSLVWFARPRRRQQSQPAGSWARKVAALAILVGAASLLVFVLMRSSTLEIVVLGLLAMLLFGRTFARAVRWLGTRFLPAKER